MQFRAFMFILVACVSAPMSVWAVTGDALWKVDSSRIVVRLRPDVEVSAAVLLQPFSRIVDVTTTSWVPEDFVICSLSTPDNLGAFRDSLLALDGVEFVDAYYYRADSTPYIAGDLLSIVFNEAVSRSEMDSLAESLGLVRVRELDLHGHAVRLMRNTGKFGINTPKLVNQLLSCKLVTRASVEFRVHLHPESYRTFDYFNSGYRAQCAGYDEELYPDCEQRHYNQVTHYLTGASVYDFGSVFEPIRVALIDDGVEPHEDLPASRIAPGWDFGDDDNDPSPAADTGQAHGVGMAGIIAASHTIDSVFSTSTGIMGISPTAIIIPIKLYQDVDSNGWESSWTLSFRLIEALDFAWDNDADIICLGYNLPDGDPKNPSLDYALELVANFAGDFGLGCPIIAPAGAGNFPAVGYPASSPYVFSVGASQWNGLRYDWSNWGFELDILAPSANGACLLGSVFTLDRMGNLGANPLVTQNCGLPVSWVDAYGSQNYHIHFGGTSASCALAVGTAALVLSANPELSSVDVYNTLRHSAVQLGAPGWTDSTGWGRLDAYRAVLAVARGDIDNNGVGPDVADLSRLIDFLFVTFEPITPDLRLADANCDGYVDVGDISALNAAIFGIPYWAPLPLPCFVY